MTEASIIEGLKNGDNAVLKSIYLEYRDAFVQFSKKYNITEYDALDLYQDAILALKENVATGKLKELKSSIKTYLFSIGKYMVFDYLRANKKVRVVDNEDLKLFDLVPDFEILFKEESNSDEKKLELAFSALGDKCKAVLKLFYYQDYTIEEITKILGYNSKDVVKSQKSRCLKSLKEKFENGR